MNGIDDRKTARAHRLKIPGFRVQRRTLLVSLVLAVSGATMCATAQFVAASPNLVNYQGTLFLARDSATPVTGYQNLVFRLHTEASGGDLVWAELHRDVPVANGVFSVFLGAGGAVEGEPHALLEDVFHTSPEEVEGEAPLSPEDYSPTSPLWLGISVGLDAELPQRQLITSVPYALTATHVTTATHGVRPGTIIMFAGPAANVPQGWVLCNGQAYDGAQPSEYAVLYEAIGDAWNKEDEDAPPSGFFNVPDFRSRTPIGLTGLNVPGGIKPRTTPGEVGGAPTVVLGLEHLPDHQHTFYDRQIETVYEDLVGTIHHYAASAPNSEGEPMQTGPAGSPIPMHSNLQPYAGIFFIIKL